MTFIVTDTDLGKRLDVFLSERTELSRSAIARLVEEKRITVGGNATLKRYAVMTGDVIELDIPEPTPSEAQPENIPLDVVFEDGDILVVNKPSGMVVHPAHGHDSGTLVNALLYHCGDSLSGVGGVKRPGIVHRIDKDTSGLIVIAKNDAAHLALSREIAVHGVVREYHALVRGGFKTDTGTVNLPIGRHPTDRKRMAVLTSPESNAKEAITHYEVLESFGEISYLKLRLETGRTHQIRVHMSHLGHALIGDDVYRSSRIRFEKEHAALLDGQILHARRLTLTHPRTGERMTFESELPDNFKKLLLILKEENK